jgi:hypothetical protein
MVRWMRGFEAALSTAAYLSVIRFAMLRLVALVFATVCASAFASQVPTYAGTLVLAGGEVDDNNTAVYGPMVRAAGGHNAVVAVVTAASDDGCCDPDSSWVLYNSIFATYSPANIFWVPIDVNHTHNNANATILKQLAAATLIFFSGGDQTRVVASFFNGDHVVSPALELIRAKFFSTTPGFAVGGSSAGTACQPSSVMIANGLSYSALVNGSIPRQSDGEDNLLCCPFGSHPSLLPAPLHYRHCSPPLGTILKEESVYFRIPSTPITPNAAVKVASSACSRTPCGSPTDQQSAWPSTKTRQQFTRRRLQSWSSQEEPAARARGFTMSATRTRFNLPRDGPCPTCWFPTPRTVTA